MSYATAAASSFVPIPPRDTALTFMMGSARCKNAQPVREVAFTPGEMGIAPVTVEQFTAYIEKYQRLGNNWGRLIYGPNGHVRGIWWVDLRTFEHQLGAEFNVIQSVSRASPLKKLIPTMEEFIGRFARLKDGVARFLKPDHPIVMVNWYEAWTCAFLAGGRLAMEAEWECAARAGREGDGLYGTDTGKLTPENAHWNHNGKVRETAPVKSYPPNPWGFYDMTGNVKEWVHDWYAGSYAGLPTLNPAGPLEGSTRVLRGGSFSDSESELGVAYRSHEQPHRCYTNIGFRVFLPKNSSNCS